MPCSTRNTALAVALLVCPAATADEPKPEKPPTFALLNRAKDIRLISDRDEPIRDCFRRNRVLVGTVLPEGLDQVLRTKEPLRKFFVSYASQNDDPAKASTFGATLEVAPPSAVVVKLLKEHKGKAPSLTLILRRDAKKPGLYHAIGCTERTSVGFFDNDQKNATDGFSQKDLCYREEPKP
jgi:hypothetical protein